MLPMKPYWNCFRRTSIWPVGSGWPVTRWNSRGCLPGFVGWGMGSEHGPGLMFNELVASGRVRAPIVIGRDHLDSGSVASPNRETESMRGRLGRYR